MLLVYPGIRWALASDNFKAWELVWNNGDGVLFDNYNAGAELLWLGLLEIYFGVYPRGVNRDLSRDESGDDQNALNGGTLAYVCGDSGHDGWMGQLCKGV